jgi:replicative DNA helicase
VFIDYLGLLDDTCRENQNIRLGQISRNLKALQMKLGVPVITAHQLNRGVEHREDKEPSLSDIRESGHIEEDADTVLMLFRDSYYTDTTDLTTKIKIAKQRQGDAGLIVRVLYDKKNQTYKDLRGD